MEYPSFVEDQLFLDMDATVPEVEQLRAMLNNLTRIHLLTADKFESFDDLIREYLIAGIDVLGLETGIVDEVKNCLVRGFSQDSIKSAEKELKLQLGG